MPANFGILKTGLANYLKTNTSPSPEDTGRMIGNLYVASVSQAVVTVSQALIIPPNPNAIANGFAKSFKSSSTTREGEEPRTNWSIAAGAVVGEFAKLQINSFPPIAPALGPTSGYSVTYPGNVQQLTKDIADAFSQPDPDSCAGTLANGFIKHLESVTGIYNGFIITPAGPTPLPPLQWKGLYQGAKLPVAPIKTNLEFAPDIVAARQASQVVSGGGGGGGSSSGGGGTPSSGGGTQTTTQTTGNEPVDTENTPNANRLRDVLKILGYKEKGQELSNGGDITSITADYGIAVANKIKETLPNVAVTFTSGNDAFHQNLSYNSRHKSGRALDFVVSPNDRNTLDKIVDILKGFAAGEYPNARFIDEYANPTKAASGKHFHMSWGAGTEAQSTINLAKADAQAGRIDTYFV